MANFVLLLPQCSAMLPLCSAMLPLCSAMLPLCSAMLPLCSAMLPLCSAMLPLCSAMLPLCSAMLPLSHFLFSRRSQRLLFSSKFRQACPLSSDSMLIKRLRIEIEASQVRLKTDADDPYTWERMEGKEHLFPNTEERRGPVQVLPKSCSLANPRYLTRPKHPISLTCGSCVSSNLTPPPLLRLTVVNWCY